MRLWHKDLISVLPRQQLLGQWRECCAIARKIAEKGTPGHLLVNRIMDFPLDHFIQYCALVGWELRKRGYKCKWVKLMMWTYKAHPLPFVTVASDDLFSGWHNMRYYRQCYYNLQEKFDCGGIPEAEWERIECIKPFF